MKLHLHFKKINDSNENIAEFHLIHRIIIFHRFVVPQRNKFEFARTRLTFVKKKPRFSKMILRVDREVHHTHKSVEKKKEKEWKMRKWFMKIKENPVLLSSRFFLLYTCIPLAYWQRHISKVISMREIWVYMRSLLGGASPRRQFWCTP